MSNFEKEYYEFEQFWEGGSLEDAFTMLRINKTLELIPSEVTSLADIGCGNGVFINNLSLRRPEIRLLGVDRSSAALKYVKVDRIEASIESLPIKDEEFDCVTCLEVLEHIAAPVYRKSLEELIRISRKYIILSVPFDETIEAAYTKCPGCKSIFNRDLHLRKFNTADMKGLLNEWNFKCVDVFTTGELSHVRHLDKLNKYLYAEKYLEWNSPICPICGFAEKETKKKRSFVRRVKDAFYNRLISVWPKYKKCYWIIALYKKEM